MATSLNWLASEGSEELSIDENWYDWDDWDPTKTYIEDIATPTSTQRISIDVMKCVNSGNQNILVVPDSKSNFHAHAVIVGPEETPYDGGFFYFFINFPTSYPVKPPRVKLMNTDHNSVRFNPNINKNGKVRLSMLNTCISNAPEWSPSDTLYDLLICIRSLIRVDPFDNTLGMHESKETDENPLLSYIDYIRHETIRVAVINFMKKDNTDISDMPDMIREKVAEIFTQKIHFYFGIITENMFLDTVDMCNPFDSSVNGQQFDYNSLKTQMCDLTKVYLKNLDAIRHTFELFNIETGALDDFEEKSEDSDVSEMDSNSNSS